MAPIIVEVLGPTGVGKSALAIRLAKRFKGEIVSADSMQIYRGFDVGTAKIRRDEMMGVPHYGIDQLEPTEQYNAFRFLQNTWTWVKEIEGNDRLPIVCGGTALYLRGLQQGFFEEKSETALRNRLSMRAEIEGLRTLWLELAEVDPEYARKIGGNDQKRIVRGLEILAHTGLPPTQAFLTNRTPFTGYRFVRVGLNIDRSELYQRIDERVDKMMRDGLLEEVRDLLLRYPSDAPPFQGVGYKELCAHLGGKSSLEGALALIKQHSRNFAKRQLSWWRQEDDIAWFSPQQEEAIVRYIQGRV